MTSVKIGITSVLILTASIAGLSVLAQTGTQTPVIDKKQNHQQERIAQGVSSGSLTAKETVRLEKQQAYIAKEEDKAKADGVVSKRERVHIRKDQARASRSIARKKHN